MPNPVRLTRKRLLALIVASISEMGRRQLDSHLFSAATMMANFRKGVEIGGHYLR